MVSVFYIVLGAIFAGYFALAGYDYGVAILLRRTAKTDEQRRLVLGALGPFFLGNEVWLVAGLGLLIGVFPLADGELLSGLYPVLIGLIAAIVVFTAAVQLRSRFLGGRRLWDLTIVGMGFVIAAGWGAVFGLVLQGFPLRFGPLPFMTGVLTTVLFVMHGAGLLVVRVPDPMRSAAVKIACGMVFPAVVLTLATGLTAILTADAITRPWPAAALVVVLAGVCAVVGRAHRSGRHGWGVMASGAAAALPVIITGIAMLPYLYVHIDNSRSLTIAQSAASPASLHFLALVALPLLPVLLGFQLATWWMWRRAPQKPSFY